MALDPQSGIGQVDALNNGLAEYFSLMGKYLNGSNPTLPLISDYVVGLDYGELHRLAVQSGYDSPNYSTGAIIDSISQILSLQRDLGLSQKLKSDYYNDASAEYSNEANFYATLKVNVINSIKGIGSLNSSQ